MNKIQQALAKLDIRNDNHWTEDGDPRLDTVRLLAGDQTITREEINEECKGFKRTGNVSAPLQPPVADPGAATTTASSNTENTGGGDSTPPPVVEAQPIGDLEAEKAKLVELEDALNKAKAAFDAQTKIVDSLIVVNEPQQQALADHVAHYHASQQRLAEERIAKKKLILESGIPLKELVSNLRSPLDSRLGQRRR